MFCPSKLQQRMNEWCPQKARETVFSDIFATPINWRFSGQFLLIVYFFSLPLLGYLSANSTLQGWILLPTVLLSAYGVAFWFLPSGFYIPVVFFLIYSTVPQLVSENLALGLQTLQRNLPPLPQVFLGILLCCGIFGFNNRLSVLVSRKRLKISKAIFVLSSSVAVLIGGWISTQSWLFSSCSGIVVAFSLLLIQHKLDFDDEMDSISFGVAAIVPTIIALLVSNSITAVVAFAFLSNTTAFVSVSIAAVVTVGTTVVISCTLVEIALTVVLTIIKAVTSFIISGGVLGRIPMVVPFDILTTVLALVSAIVSTVVLIIVSAISAFIVVVLIASASRLPLVIFLITTALVSFSCSYARQQWLGWWLGAVFIALGAEQMGLSVLFALPIALVFYYRIIPEYCFFLPIPFHSIFNFPNRKQSQSITSQHAKVFLMQLPPLSSELLWFSIPHHETLLAKVFHSQLSFGLQTLQTMQTSPLLGLQRTAQRALPLILTDYLSSFRDITNFQQLTGTTEDISSTTPDTAHSNNLLSVLLPNFYSVPSDNADSTNPLPTAELTAILPRLRNIAQDTAAALQASNLALQERGLESVLKRLEMLPSQLPSLGLTAQAIQRWNPVIQCWQNLLALELDEQKKRSQGELLNPFQYGNPLQRNRSDLFKGRQTFAENIARILLDRNRPTIVLHGPRRCGKTSFLNNLPRLLPSQWIPVFIDAQSAATTTDEAAFCQTLVRAIIRDGAVQGVKFPASPTRPEFLSAPYVTLENWLQIALDELKKTDKDKRLLLTIDEFEKIGTAIDAGKLSTDLFDELRSLIQHWDQLGFVFSGVQTLNELGPNWSSYFISVVPVEMLYLHPYEARELLTNPDPDFSLTYAPGLIDEILQLTQCHPNLVQLIGAALVTEANESHTTVANTDMLQAAIPRALTLGNPYFYNVWTEFTGNPQNPAEVQRGQTLLKALSQGTHPPAHADELTKSALRRMERYHVLKVEAGQYTFDIPLIQRWVKERAILE